MEAPGDVLTLAGLHIVFLFVQGETQPRTSHKDDLRAPLHSLANGWTVPHKWIKTLLKTKR